jgi:hypothetical protein
MSRLQRVGAALGLLLLLAYGLPLFVPPSATWPVPPAPDAGLWERVFPGVPAWWVLGRLLCLFVGAGSIVLCMRLPLAFSSADGPVAPREARMAQGASPLQWVALFLALGQVVSGLFAARFTRFGETLYFLFLAVPAGVLAVSERRGISRALRAMLPRVAALLVVPALWLAWLIPAAWRSPRAASVVDGWLAVERLAEVALGHRRALVDSAIPGFTNAYMILEGVPFLSPHRLQLTFAWLQAFHFFWTVVAALAIGVLVCKLVSLAAAVVAQAVFLFSPFVLSFPYDPLPIFLGPLCAAVLLLLLLAVHRSHSGAAVAAFGAVAGFSGRIPQLGLLTLLLCALLAYALSRLSRVPWVAIGTAILSCIAAVIPAFPDVRTFQQMLSRFTLGHGQTVGMVLILFGQQAPLTVPDALHAGRYGVFDIPIGALLAPFAIARTPLRLLGDTLLDPVGTALMASGLIICTRHLPRSRTAAIILALLVTSLATALVSAGDAVSHTRLVAALVPLALLAAVAFEALQRRLAGPSGATSLTVLTVAVIASGGTFLFEKVNPRILPSSSLAISVDALGAAAPAADVVFLEHGGPYNLSWLHTRRIPTQLPAQPVRVLTVEEFERHELTAPAPPPRLYFWSPGLERDAGVAGAICDRWPGAAVYTLMDDPGLFSAFAAAPRGAIWLPHLPARRWSVSFCAAEMCPEGPAPLPALPQQ